MRVLRTALFRDPDSYTVFVVRDVDIRVPLDEFIAGWTSGAPAGAFWTYQTFSAPRGTSIVEATREAHRRFQHAYSDYERNMAILFFWDAQHLRLLTPHGFLSPTQPAPLATDQIVFVFEQLARHPNYTPGMTVRAWSRDGGPVVEIKNGVVTRASPSRMNG